MKKRYKLLTQAILIFIVALSVNLIFKPAHTNAANGYCSCNYTIKDGADMKECYFGWEDATDDALKNCESWQMDLYNDPSIDTSIDSGGNPIHTFGCSPVTECDPYTTGPLVNRIKSDPGAPPNTGSVCCFVYKNSIFSECWNTKPENCSADYQNHPGSCTLVPGCADKTKSAGEAICDQTGCRALSVLEPAKDTRLGNLMNDLSARKPILQINIPGLNFSNVASTTDETGTYFYIAWIPELISALYKFGIAIVSIVAVVVIIIQGMRIVTSGGGEAKTSAYKKIGQAVVGLMIAWGSFAILYNINPALVQFNALKVQVVKGIPIDTFEKTDYEGEVVSASDLDPLFAAYAACYGYDPVILKGIATVESGLKPYANPGKKYQGLFQMDKDYCVAGLAKGGYPDSLKLDCNNRIEPETNTAAAAATIYENINDFILKQCPQATAGDVISLAYVAHNNGPSVMKFAISDKVCTGASIRANVRKFYETNGTPLGQRVASCDDDNHNKGALAKYANKYSKVLNESTKAYKPNTGCVTADWGEGKYDTGLKVAKIAGNSPIFPSGGKKDSICPTKTGTRAVGKIANNTSRKILALGDSLTEGGNSHASKLQQLTGIPMDNVAVSGKNTQWMINKINTIDLQAGGYTDLLILGGANDIPGGETAANVKSRLLQIYKKAKSANMRVIALTITPFYNYGKQWTAPKQTALEDVNIWIKEKGKDSEGKENIDVVIDANSIIADPEHKERILPSYDPFYPNCPSHGTPPKTTCPDYELSIHFNAAGHAAIAAKEKAEAF